MISIEIQDGGGAIRRALNALAQASANLSEPLKAIGENLAESTKQRFHDSTGPDGEVWAANAQATIDAYVAKFHGASTKRGGLSKYGGQVLASKKPLIGETRYLSTNIYSELVGKTGVAVGSPAVYSAMQQFGGDIEHAAHSQRHYFHVDKETGQSRFAKKKKANFEQWAEHPAWTQHIPARPFLGASVADRDMILETLARYLKQALG